MNRRLELFWVIIRSFPRGCQFTTMASWSAASVAMAQPEVPRPTMRRKSSAQTLLSSFKSGPNPSPTPTSGGSISSNAVPSFATVGMPAYAAAAATPSATVFNPASMIPREFDSQSLHSEATLVNGTSTALPAGTSVEYLRDLVQKRIITLTYMRNVHEG